jgi:hypothetical protein
LLYTGCLALNDNKIKCVCEMEVDIKMCTFAFSLVMLLSVFPSWSLPFRHMQQLHPVSALVEEMYLMWQKMDCVNLIRCT